MSIASEGIGFGARPEVSAIGASISALQPYGVVLQARAPGADVRTIPGARLRALAEEHAIVLLRGFSLLSREELAAYAATLGEIYTWEFGAVLDLFAHEQPKNYLFANGSVPLHWDGAFRESVPSLQFFQCLRAPLPGLGGETFFSHTTRALERAAAEQRARWADLSITYTTDKVAHYGGVVHARLVSKHPKTGRPTLRIGLPNDAETSPENPVLVSVDGLSAEESDALLASLRDLLHSKELCYTHTWRDGDMLIADNHTLVHGRRSFRAHSPRHLQRVHIR